MEYPRERDAGAAAQPDTLHRYDIRDPQGRLHPIYVVVIDRGGLGEFYDVQGTTWTDPPLLSDPSQTVHIGSRTYSLFYSGEEIRTIAWQEEGAAYWIQNTLTNSVQPREMLAMAELTLPVIGTAVGGAHSVAAIPDLRGLRLPPRELAAPSLASKLAAALGIFGLAAVALLAVLVLSRRRELIHLREQVAVAMALEAQQRPLLATHAGSIPTPEPAPTIYHARKTLAQGRPGRRGRGHRGDPRACDDSVPHRQRPSFARSRRGSSGRIQGDCLSSSNTPRSGFDPAPFILLKMLERDGAAVDLPYNAPCPTSPSVPISING